MRIWLDAHEITPTEFHLFGGPIVGLEVRFSSPEQAALFEQEFGPKNQPTTIVPTDLRKPLGFLGFDDATINQKGNRNEPQCAAAAEG